MVFARLWGRQFVILLGTMRFKHFFWTQHVEANSAHEPQWNHICFTSVCPLHTDHQSYWFHKHSSVLRDSTSPCVTKHITSCKSKRSDSPCKDHWCSKGGYLTWAIRRRTKTVTKYKKVSMRRQRCPVSRLEPNIHNLYNPQNLLRFPISISSMTSTLLPDHALAILPIWSYVMLKIQKHYIDDPCYAAHMPPQTLGINVMTQVQMNTTHPPPTLTWRSINFTMQVQRNVNITPRTPPPTLTLRRINFTMQVLRNVNITPPTPQKTLTLRSINFTMQVQRNVNITPPTPPPTLTWRSINFMMQLQMNVNITPPTPPPTLTWRSIHFMMQLQMNVSIMQMTWYVVKQKHAYSTGPYLRREQKLKQP